MSNVFHPSHYTHGKYEAIDVIEDWKLNYNLGNVLKYVCRAGKKDDIVQDLEKAKWYIDREINRIKSDVSKLPLLNAMNNLDSQIQLIPSVPIEYPSC